METPARFAVNCGKLRRFAERFAVKFVDKFGFDQVSLETTRIDITFHNFFPNQAGCFHSCFRNQPGCFHSFFRNQPGRFHVVSKHTSDAPIQVDEPSLRTQIYVDKYACDAPTHVEKPFLGAQIYVEKYSCDAPFYVDKTLLGGPD